MKSAFSQGFPTVFPWFLSQELARARRGLRVPRSVRIRDGRGVGTTGAPATVHRRQ